MKIILSNPYYDYACGLAPLIKFTFYYSCRLKASIFTESKLFCNTQKQCCSQMFWKIRDLKHFANLRVNNCAYSLELYERPAILLKAVRFQHRCFAATFANFLRTPFSQNTSGRLLP